MSEIWSAAKRGFMGGVSLSLKLWKVFFIWLPCIVFFALPAYIVGYAWCWIVGGFRAGELVFTTEQSTPFECWNVVITVKEQEASK